MVAPGVSAEGCPMCWGLGREVRDLPSEVTEGGATPKGRCGQEGERVPQHRLCSQDCTQESGDQAPT